MKICYIADGQSVHTERLVNHFARQGHTIHLISSRFSSNYEASIHIHPLSRIFPRTWSPFKFINGLWWLYEAKKLVKKINPDILDAHFINISGYLGYASGFHPFIMSTWGSDILIEPENSILARWAAKRVLKRADFVTCTSEFLYNTLKEFTPLNKVKIVPFGVDCERFKPMPKNEAKSGKTIGIIKALQPIYGIEYLIQAVPFIVKEFKDLKVLIVGGGNQEPYNKLARETDVENFIQFAGKVQNKDVPEYLAQMDVFVMPSLSESFGVAALEAQAMEVPVVASRVGGIPEVVRDGLTGLLVESKNPKAIADAVIKLLSNDSLRQQMGKHGREHVKKNYNWGPNMEEREKVYRELIEKYKQSH